MLSLLLAQTDYTTDYATSTADAAAGAAGLGILGGLFILWLVLAVGGFALFLWALIDVIRRQFPNPNNKVLWIVLIIFIGWIGPLVYLIVGRKQGSIPGAAAAAK